MTIPTIESYLVAESDRSRVVDEAFGIRFPFRLEPTIYAFAERLSPDYRGGYWHFYLLSSGAFYMAPKGDTPVRVISDNGFEGDLSADALGITACLYAYSHLNFGGDDFAYLCAEHYHRLREFAMEHREVGAILAAID